MDHRVTQSDPGLTTIQQMPPSTGAGRSSASSARRCPTGKPYAWFEDCDLELCRSVVDGRVGEMLTVGGRALRSEEKCYADNAFPALYVQSLSRSVVCDCGDSCVLQGLTTFFTSTPIVSLWTLRGQEIARSRTPRQGLGRPGQDPAPRSHHPRPDSSSPHGMDYVCPVCHDPQCDKMGFFSADVTESFRGGASSGRGGEVVTRSRPFRLKGTDERRVHLAGGFTEARQHDLRTL